MQSIDIGASLTEVRFRVAQFLVLVCFVVPFFNFNHFFAQSEVEVNFLPVFLAVLVLPEVFLADGLSVFLLAATLGMSVLLAPTESVLRLIIGAVPCLFLLNLNRHCLSRGRELIPRSLAYRTLQVFVSFSALQWFSLNVLPVIPGWFTEVLATIVPRYSGEAYDEFGVRGVQGWASEPAGAAMVCFSFAIVAAQQEPKKRLRILVLLVVLLAVNKSVYAVGLLAILGVVYLFSLKHKWYSVAALVLLSVGLAWYVSSSNRIEDFAKSAAIYGVEPDINYQLFRVNQIIAPLAAFPRIYHPVYIFDHYIEPMGLLPLLVGYGGVLGLALYVRLAFFEISLRHARSPTIALASLFVLSFLVPPDLIPPIIAFLMHSRRLKAPFQR